MSHSSTTSATAGRDASGGRRRSAGRRLSRSSVLVGIGALAAVLFVLDQVTKHWAEANLVEGQSRPFIGELLQLTLLYNSGAAWGMGASITPVVTVLQLAIAVSAIIFAMRVVRSPWYTVALGLVIGGALGNIHDRLLRAPGPFRGWVVDFLQLPRWPIFNVADMAVVAGALLIVLISLLGLPADPASESASEEAPAAGSAGATCTRSPAS